MRNRYFVIGLALIALWPWFASAQAKPAARPKPKAAPAADKASTPSLAETTDWIKDALSSHGKVTVMTNGKNGWWSKEDFTSTLTNADGCKLGLHRVYIRQDKFSGDLSRNQVSQSTISVNLKNLDPASGKLGEFEARSDENATFTHGGYYISFQTTNLAKSVEAKTTGRVAWSNRPSEEEEKTEQAAGVYLRVDDKDVAERLLRAFSHAVTLCGAKKSIF